MGRKSSVIHYLMVALMMFALGFYMGGAGCAKSEQEQPEKEAKVEAKSKINKDIKLPEIRKADEERFKIPLDEGDYFKGPENAPITIVEYSEFQCPFCRRVNPTITQLMTTYKNQIKVVFKHNPLPFHKDAFLASEAALAAGAQGKFWEMHDQLFANQRALKREDLEKYAQEIGLDMATFKADLDSHKYKKLIEEDMETAKNFAARGTPHLFINGIRLRGAQPFEKFQAVVDAELPAAKALADKGVDNIYAAVTKNAKTKAEEPKAKPREDDDSVYDISTGNKRSAKGNISGALVTIVEFSDYQCPFCKRGEDTIKKVMDHYGDKVRVFFRQNPLSFHKDALPAAKAALAAREQGKFWEYHEMLFDNAKALKEENLLDYAKKVGLDMAKFKKDMTNPAFEAEIKQDQQEAAKFGARGTPAFFINGRKLVGAQPFESFKKVIDEQIAKAQKVGKTGDALYEALTKDGLDKAAAEQPKQNKPAEDNRVYDVPAGNSYYKGPKNAPVEIIEFSEFQCPFCSRVNPTISKIMEEYKGKVKVVFKHNPLPFHKDAPLASQAALAAGEQGKFWEMHDKLFANQRQLKREDLEKYAQEIGLDMGKFKKALDSGAYASAIDEDQKLAAKVGARGTPTFFVNGRKLVGAQPYEKFKEKIEEALKAKK